MWAVLLGCTGIDPLGLEHFPHFPLCMAFQGRLFQGKAGADRNECLWRASLVDATPQKEVTRGSQLEFMAMELC